MARELIEKYSLTQVDAAKKLGVTQAAISQYLRLKRGHKGLEGFEEFIPLIQSTASEVASHIVSGKIDSERVMLKFCEICFLIQKSKLLK